MLSILICLSFFCNCFHPVSCLILHLHFLLPSEFHGKSTRVFVYTQSNNKSSLLLFVLPYLRPIFTQIFHPVLIALQITNLVLVHFQHQIHIDTSLYEYLLFSCLHFVQLFLCLLLSESPDKDLNLT